MRAAAPGGSDTESGSTGGVHEGARNAGDGGGRCIAAAGGAALQAPKSGGYVLERDADVAVSQPGTHNGGGQTIGSSFFKTTPELALVFRKRALKPGAGIGYPEQKEDEILPTEPC